jgi:hypothetical protein
MLACGCLSKIPRRQKQKTNIFQLMRDWLQDDKAKSGQHGQGAKSAVSEPNVGDKLTRFQPSAETGSMHTK